MDVPIVTHKVPIDNHSIESIASFDNPTQENAIAQLSAQRLRLMPLERGTKGDFHYRWSHIRYTGFSAWSFLEQPYNVAILCGRGSDGLYLNVIDCDNFDLYTDIRRTWVIALQMPFWGHLTARGGHVLFKTRHQLTTVAIENIDFKASGYVLAPSSLHTSGATYQFDTANNDDCIPVIPDDRLQGISELIGIKLKRKGNSKQAIALEAYLSDGAIVGNRNNTAYQMAQYAGATDKASQDELVARAMQDGLSHREALSATRGVKGTGANKPTSTLARAKAWVQANLSNGYTIALAEALIKRAHCEHGKTFFEATLRSLVELSGLANKTVLRHLAILQTKGFITRVFNPSDGKVAPMVWRFTEAVKQYEGKSTPLSEQVYSRSELVVYIFPTRKSLGYSTNEILRAIQPSDTIATIAKRLNRAKRMVRYHIDKLIKHGIVGRAEDGVLSLLMAEGAIAQLVAQDDKAMNWQANTRNRHENERQAHADNYVIKRWEEWLSRRQVSDTAKIEQDAQNASNPLEQSISTTTPAIAPNAISATESAPAAATTHTLPSKVEAVTESAPVHTTPAPQKQPTQARNAYAMAGAN